MDVVYKSLACAKINLFLNVVGKRQDGYHLLDSLVAFCDFGDSLELSIVNQKEGIQNENLLLIEGEFAQDLKHNIKGDNIILQALNFMQKSFDIKDRMLVRLNKNLPIGAGIGGGSSNCAITLIACNSLFNLGLEHRELQNIAINFGADVPVCLNQKMSFFEGIGEKVTEIQGLSNDFALPIILINPRVYFDTRTVFQNYDGGYIKKINIKEFTMSNKEYLYDILKQQGNSLSEVVQKLYPNLAFIIDSLEKTKPRVARMSGSGLTCFALYDTKDQARQAFLQLRDIFPNYWIKEGHLR